MSVAERHLEGEGAEATAFEGVLELVEGQAPIHEPIDRQPAVVQTHQ